MQRLQHASLVRQTTWRATFVISLGLLLTLPFAGWWLGHQVGKQASILTSSDTARQPASNDATETLSKNRIADAGQRVHRQLVSALLLHDEEAEVGAQRLPLITFKGKPVFAGTAEWQNWLDPSQQLSLYVLTENGFRLTARSDWTESPFLQAGAGLDEALERVASTDGQPYSIQTLTQEGTSKTVYVRALRNTAGEVSALMVLDMPVPAQPPAGIARPEAPLAAAAAKKSLQQLAGWIAPVALVLALLLSALLTAGLWMIMRSTLSPLKQLTTALLRLSTGDLGARAHDPDMHPEGKTRNELSLLARSINRMADQTGQLVRTLQTDSQQIAQAAAELSDAANQICDDSQRESNAAIGMAAAVEEMTNSISSVGQNAEEARGISQRAHELVREGSAAVASATHQMQTLSQTVESTSSVIAQLGNQSRQISAIAAMIREIAEQTNLLALNAAIEAARAGENGRGFSVVADEVRRLAERTSDSTEEIRGMIDAIQDSAQIAVDNMQSAVACVKDGVDLVGHVGETIGRIHEDASHVADAVDAIHMALREQNSASSSIAQQVDCVAHMSRTTHATAAQAVDATRQLENTAQTIRESLKKFSVARAG